MVHGPLLSIALFDKAPNMHVSSTCHPEKFTPYLEGTFVMLKCVPHQIEDPLGNIFFYLREPPGSKILLKII